MQRVYLEQDMQEPELLPFAGGEVAVLSSRSPGKESANEDGAAVLELGSERGLLAVADGMGGGRIGEAASRIALESLDKELKRDGEASVRESVLSALENANRRVLELGVGAGTTLAMAEVSDGKIRPYHIGDSHFLLVGQRGKVKKLTLAHSPVAYAVESGLLDESEAMHHDDRHIVSNIVGQADMHIEMGSPIRFTARDTLVLATDGVFDNLGVDEIVELVRKGPLRKCVSELFSLVSARMRGEVTTAPSKPDDATMVVFRPTAGR